VVAENEKNAPADSLESLRDVMPPGPTLPAQRSLSPCHAEHVVGREGPPDPLQLELAHWFDLHRVFDLHQYSWTDEDLPRLGFVAKTGSDVKHRTRQPVASRGALAITVALVVTEMLSRKWAHLGTKFHRKQLKRDC
jgi:hypothetical protein